MKGFVYLVCSVVTLVRVATAEYGHPHYNSPPPAPAIEFGPYDPPPPPSLPTSVPQHEPKRPPHRPKENSDLQCSYENQGYFLTPSRTPAEDADLVCQECGGTLAPASRENFAKLTDILIRCLGPHSSAWIQSWEANTYPDTTLAIFSGARTGVGSVNINLSGTLHALCELPTIPEQPFGGYKKKQRPPITPQNFVGGPDLHYGPGNPEDHEESVVQEENMVSDEGTAGKNEDVHESGVTEDIEPKYAVAVEESESDDDEAKVSRAQKATLPVHRPVSFLNAANEFDDEDLESEKRNVQMRLNNLLAKLNTRRQRRAVDRQNRLARKQLY